MPASVTQSQIVPWYMPQDDGMKSRCRLVTTITYRSSHIPMFMTRAMDSKTHGRDRTHADQRNCGVTHVAGDQQPVVSRRRGRSCGWTAKYCSNTLPLYQAMKASMM